jgi:hypothetical protein
MDLDVTMTATIRPEIVKRTIQSFHENLLHVADYRVIVNVDPVGHANSAIEVQDVLRQYCKHVIAFYPRVPNFPAAFKKVWEEATADFVLSLEDDWQLMYPMSLLRMIEILSTYPKLALLRLPFRPTGMDSAKNWQVFFPWNGDYFECPTDQRGSIGFCGHPSLIKRRFIADILPFLSEDSNPEKQFHARKSPLMDVVLQWDYGVFGEQGAPPAVVDIGREWMLKNGFVKRGNKAFFKVWEKTHG